MLIRLSDDKIKVVLCVPFLMSISLLTLGLALSPLGLNACNHTDCSPPTTECLQPFSIRQRDDSCVSEAQQVQSPFLRRPPILISQSSPNTSDSTARILFDGGSINQTSLTRYTYLGDCPGTSSTTRWASFQSTSTSPHEGYRVLLNNTSLGSPFTDREYHNGSSSEKTNVILGNSHSSKYFVLSPGANSIEYKIYKGRKKSRIVLDSGFITVSVLVRDVQQVRNSTTRTERICAVSLYASEECADYRTKSITSCPDGKVLHQSILPEGNIYRTTIYNSTSQPQTIYINGIPILLYPGAQHELMIDKYYTQSVYLGSSSYTLSPGKRNVIKYNYQNNVGLSTY